MTKKPAKRRSPATTTAQAPVDIVDVKDFGAVPEDFEEVFGERVVGWFIPRAGNAIQGILRDVFEMESKFRRKGEPAKKRRVYKIEVTNAAPSKLGATSYLLPSNDDEEVEEAKAKVGDLVGIDEKGYLKALTRVMVGQEVWIACLGKQPPSSEYPQGVWLYKVLAKPAKVNEVTGEVMSEVGKANEPIEDDFPL